MLVVKVELWPGGDATRKELIAQATAANISGLAETSDYFCRVMAEGSHDLGIEPTAANFIVKNHERSTGVIELLRRIFYHAATRDNFGVRDVEAEGGQENG